MSRIVPLDEDDIDALQEKTRLPVEPPLELGDGIEEPETTREDEVDTDLGDEGDESGEQEAQDAPPAAEEDRGED